MDPLSQTRVKVAVVHWACQQAREVNSISGLSTKARFDRHFGDSVNFIHNTWRIYINDIYKSLRKAVLEQQLC